MVVQPAGTCSNIYLSKRLLGRVGKVFRRPESRQTQRLWSAERHLWGTSWIPGTV